MTDKIVSFKTGRKPVILTQTPVVLTVIGILGAFAKASNAISYPEYASSREKDMIFCQKIADLSSGHNDLSPENLKSTCDYLEATVKFAKDCKIAGDDAIEKAGESLPRELTEAEMAVFDSFDDMNATQLTVMKSVLDLFTAKLRASFESNDVVHPENANNETMLMIVEHIIGQGSKKTTSKFTSKKRPAEKKSARFSMGASTDSQQTDDIPDLTDDQIDEIHIKRQAKSILESVFTGARVD